MVDADTAYASKQYAVAAELLKEEHSKESNPIKKSEIAYKIAECYNYSNTPQKAAQWYKTAMEYAQDPIVTLKYGLMQKHSEDYEAAIETFKLYSLDNPLDKRRATKEINACRKAMEWTAEPSRLSLKEPSGLNSTYSDFSPVFYENQSLVFSSSRTDATGEEKYGWTGQDFFDLFIADGVLNNEFTGVRNFDSKINTDYNEGTVTFSADYRTMVFTRCGSADPINDYCDLFIAYRGKDGLWSDAVMMNLFEDTVNVAQPYLSPDGKEIYFSSDAYGGYGEKDLYVSKKTIDGWSFPTNLGPEINTEGYEGFPYIHTNGDLYFASDGHLGMGGLDIFKAKRASKNRFSAVDNLKAPINSGSDDFGIIFKPFLTPEAMDSIEEAGYFTSSRSGGTGGDDIYYFQLNNELPIDSNLLAQNEEEPEEEPKEDIEEPEVIIPIKTEATILPPIYILKGKILRNVYANEEDPNSKVVSSSPIPDAVAEILGLGLSSISGREITDTDGTFSILVEADTDYRLSGSSPGYFRQSKTVSTKGYNPAPGESVEVYAEIVLDKIFLNKEVTMENIYYDLDQSDIRSDAALILDNLVEVLYENPGLRIELGSHTDSRGSDNYNQGLSQERAQSAVNYLNGRGIDGSRLVARGYGESALVNECEDGVDCSDEQHQENRRTTFKVLR